MNLLERLWAYITLGATAIAGEASPLIGGFAAFETRLRLSTVIVSIAIGVWIASLAIYLVARWKSRWFRKRFPRLRPIILRTVAVVRRHPWRASFAVRFAYGVRIVLLIACGVGRIPFRVYALGTAVSSIIWSIAFTVLGWTLGRTTEVMIGHLKEFEQIIGIGVVLLVLGVYIVLRRRHIGDRTVEALDRPS
jgi:membrane protein DedA with SNARE-associated domain